MAGIVDSLTRSHGFWTNVPKTLGRSRKAERCRHQRAEKAKRGTSPDPLGIQRTSAPGTRWSSGHSTIFIDMQIIAQRTSTAPNRPWRLFLMLFLNMRAARLSKRSRPFASTSGGCDRSSCQPRSAKMCRVTRRSFANTTPAVVRRPKSHATPVCLREGLRERTCVRLVSFSKPRGTFCGLREAPPSVYFGGPVADTGGDRRSREHPPAVPDTDAMGPIRS